MGDRWGLDGPPPEAYSRVTNPERFRPPHGFAERLLKSIETDFDVAHEQGYGLDPELQRNDTARPTVRLVPRSADAEALTIAFTSFPGVLVLLGHWFVEPIPRAAGATRVTRRPRRDRIDSSSWPPRCQLVGSANPSSSDSGEMGG
jgi:hypothetical protein